MHSRLEQMAKTARGLPPPPPNLGTAAMSLMQMEGLSESSRSTLAALMATFGNLPQQR